MSPRKAAAVAEYMAEVGRRGGLVSSKAKARAARANGKKGGRPRKPAGPALMHAHPIGCGVLHMATNVAELVTCPKCQAIMVDGFWAPGLTHAERSALVKRSHVKPATGAK